MEGGRGRGRTNKQSIRKEEMTKKVMRMGDKRGDDNEDRRNKGESGDTRVCQVFKLK